MVARIGEKTPRKSAAKKNGAPPAPRLFGPNENYFVEVVAVVFVDVVVVVAVPVAAGVSVDVVVVVIVEVVPVPVSSTTLGCSLAVVEVVVSVVEDSSAFLQPPRNRVADAVAAIRKRARDFFIGRSPSLKVEFESLEIRSDPHSTPGPRDHTRSPRAVNHFETRLVPVCQTRPSGLFSLF
jgi:hypothetical protein